MIYEDYLRSGQLSAALTSLQEHIRAEPVNVKYRILLFQLLVVLAQWDRALKQLDVIRRLDTNALVMVHLYRSLITCELVREQIFQGKRAPVFIGKPLVWQALLLQVLPLLVQGRYSEADDLKEQAFELAPLSSGRVNEQSFDWIADADSRLGPNLELIIEGGYRWVAFEKIQMINLEQVTNLRDLVWLPAQIHWQIGGSTPAFIPTRYPNSVSRSDNLALARQTEWEALTDNFYIGYGQRIFASSLEDHALLNLQAIYLDESVE